MPEQRCDYPDGLALPWQGGSRRYCKYLLENAVLLSMFCGAGGLDKGFEDAGFPVGMALDKKSDSVASYNFNRPSQAVGRVLDLSSATCADIDAIHGHKFNPTGVIGGPPCQSFSQANVNQRSDDVRTKLPIAFARLVSEFHTRSALDFVVMENVVGLVKPKHAATLEEVEEILTKSGFKIRRLLLDAAEYGVPQRRRRLFLVGINAERFRGKELTDLHLSKQDRISVRSAIGHLEQPTFFSRDCSPNPVHPNHWCMTPRSTKFTRPGGVQPGVAGRSFKMLSWDEPSITVAYGHREVHVHPNGLRRLSIYEAMLLQGFPVDYRLLGTMSSQIDQVSEAVPPPLAHAVAVSIKRLLYAEVLDEAA